MSRIILKISGEALKNENRNVSENKLQVILDTINLLKDNHQIGIVVGGGNFFRGRENPNIEKITGDTIGMLSTIMNALYIKDFLEKNNISTCVSTPFYLGDLIRSYTDEELCNEYDNGKVIIFGGGFGKSGYSTDSGAVMAANILESNLIIKLTNVDGVYDSDPKENINAKKFDKITYDEVLEKDLKVMDIYAIQKCKENNIKILVMNFDKYMEINKFFENCNIGTIIGG